MVGARRLEELVLVPERIAPVEHPPAISAAAAAASARAGRLVRHSKSTGETLTPGPGPASARATFWPAYPSLATGSTSVTLGETVVRCGTRLEGCSLVGADLSHANLRGGNLSKTSVVDSNLTGTNLVGANLTGARLVRDNLSGANLTGANLSGAVLVQDNLTGEPSRRCIGGHHLVNGAGTRHMLR